MRDEHDDRLYQALRQDMNGAVAKLLASIALAFRHLTAHLYQAPWSETTRGLEEKCTSGLKMP